MNKALKTFNHELLSGKILVKVSLTHSTNKDTHRDTTVVDGRINQMLDAMLIEVNGHQESILH